VNEYGSRLHEQPGIHAAPGWLFGPGRSARLRRLLILLLFPGLVLAGTLRFDFAFDDPLVVLRDPLVAGRLNPLELFGSEVRVGQVPLGYYRPLIALLYRADRALWGANPSGYHLSNLLWHLLATVLVYRVTLRTTDRTVAAWAAALLFAVLPAHAEAIGWIQGRVDLVSAACSLLTLLALLRARDATSQARWPWASLAGLMFLAALLAKESAAAIPLAWAMWEVSGSTRDRRGEPLAGVAGRFAPLAMAGLAYWLLRRWAVGDGFSYFRMSLSPVAVRALAVPSVLAEYGRVLLAPDLTLNFHRTLRVAPSLATLAIGLMVVGVLACSLVAAWRWARPLFPWTAWIPITLVPALLFTLDVRAAETGFFTAERLLYLPSVGWCVLLGSAAASLLHAPHPEPRAGWRWMLFGGLVLGYAGLTLVRLQPWAGAAELYEAMKTQPNMPVAVRALVHNNLGELYLERGEFTAARAEFQAALASKPDYAFAHNNLGVLLIRQGKPTEARPWLETAIRLDPNYSEAYGNLGAAYEAAGDLPAARRAYEAGLRVAPGSIWLAKGLTRVTGETVAPRDPRAGASR
jgi:tetratricopeptide (TPR) repeat protein